MAATPTTDATVDRLHALAIQLEAFLADAKGIRLRCLNAQDASRWPDIAPVMRLLYQPRTTPTDH